jgi:hypothetical protein
MATTKAQKQLKKDLQLEEGSVYVSSWGRVYSSPTVTADLISEVESNVYLAGALDKQQRTVFKDRKDFAVHIIDADTDEPDQDASKDIMWMVKKPDVRLWMKMQAAWRESATWGPALFNPVWGYDGAEYVLKSLRLLPSATFRRAGSGTSRIQNPILPGICLNADNEIEFWQLQSDLAVKQLQNVVMMTDPVRSGLGGRPLIQPVVPIISMLDFSWVGLMQQNNLLGAGGLFVIEVTNPKGDDVNYAQNIVNNIGRGVAFQTRQNMKIVNLGITSTNVAIDTINLLDKLITNYFSPASSISKDGTLIGGSAGPEYDLYMSYILGQQAWVEDAFEQLLQPYLDENGYTNHSIQIDIPAPQVDKSEFWLKLVDEGHKTQSISLNERRAILTWAGAELEELDDEGVQKLQDEYSKSTPASAGFGLQQAKVMTEIAKIDPGDPYAFISKGSQRKFYQATLGIQDGEA